MGSRGPNVSLGPYGCERKPFVTPPLLPPPQQWGLSGIRVVAASTDPIASRRNTAAPFCSVLLRSPRLSVAANWKSGEPLALVVFFFFAWLLRLVFVVGGAWGN